MSDRRLIEATALLRRWATEGSWDDYSKDGHLEEDTRDWLDHGEQETAEPWRERLTQYLKRDRGGIKFRIPQDLDELIADWRRLGGRC